MQQPWERDVARHQALVLEELRSWRALVLPLSALANALFFVALNQTGGRTMTTVCAFVAASSLSLWTVSVVARIEALTKPG